MRSAHPIALASVVLAFAAPGLAVTIDLSEQLGVASGTAAFVNNPPVFTIVSPTPYGIGNDIPGNFSAQPLRFTGTGNMNGVGMHSTNEGFTEIHFNLPALAPSGEYVDRFTALAGIDLNSGGTGTTRFVVQLDNVTVADVTVAAGGTPASVDVPIPPGTLTLELLTGSVVHNGAHSGWALAEVTTAPIPEPAVFAPAALVALVLSRRRR